MSQQTINVLVVDDEPLARQRLMRMVARDRDLIVTGALGSTEEASHLASEVPIDLVLLDIRLPDRDGFQLLQCLRQRGIDPFVIIVTASSEHAVLAFDVEAVDYLLKPFDHDRFAKAIARAKAAIQRARDSAEKSPLADSVRSLGPDSPSRRFPGRLLVSEGGRILFLPTHIIEFVQSAGKSVNVFAQGQCHSLREPLHEIEARLDSARFVRIHRSTIVNVEHIVEMHALFHGDYELILKRGTRLTMSRRFRDRMAPFLAGAWPA